MTIDEEAALWVACLQSPDATAQDRARFAQCQARDPAHAAAYAEFSALWGHLAEAPVRAPRRHGCRCSDHARIVRVLRCAVFAEVVANPARPFTIQAGDLSARALGTRYDASAQDVIVTECKVEATSTGTSLILHAARLRDAMLDPLPADPAATAWRKGRLVFSQRPLAEVLDELRRCRHGRIVVLNGVAGGARSRGCSVS